MTHDNGAGDFEIHEATGEPGTPRERKHPHTTTMAAASGEEDPPPECIANDPEPGEPGADQPETGGQVAIFTFSDGTKLDVEMPNAVGMGGGGDPRITKPWWRLRQGDVVINEGPLLDVMRRRPT